jgi:hypothetical protein
MTTSGTAAPADDPAAIYGAAHIARAREAQALERRAAVISNSRLAVFCAGAVAAWLAFGRGSFAATWLAIPALAFAVLVVQHDRSLRAASRARRGAAFYEIGLRHLDGRWVELPVADPPSGARAHPYAEDLDCVGRGSLFHRIDTSRTHGGAGILAGWLLEASSPEAVRDRQQAVAELRPRLDLREALATLGEEAGADAGSASLIAWGEASPVLGSARQRAAAALLPVASVALGAAWVAGIASPLPLLLALSVQAIYAVSLRARVREVVRSVDAPARELALLAGLLARVEGERFQAPRLAALQQALVAGGQPASRRVAALQRMVDLLDARRNQLFAPIAALVCWSTQISFAIDAWRRQHGPALRSWTLALGEIEALVSLAGYAYERPEDVFPELLPGGPPRFEAEGLGHPLLPVDRCVRNDVALGPDRRLLVVSGSNMSGKSTLLRAVGVNAALAQAGSVVCARRLSVSPVRVGASVQLHDSLLGGQSRFYAEIRRLQLVYQLAGAGGAGVLFLLDEILHGTNAQERRVGAEAVIRGLLAGGAVGLVTTHDLALAEMVDRVGGGAANVHFEDRVEGGELRFDYRLRPGVARQGNALALMRELGLPV